MMELVVHQRRQSMARGACRSSNKLFEALACVITLWAWAGTASAHVSADFRPWVPKGWGLVASARGDLDRDGRADAVLVLQKKDASKVLPVKGLGGPTMDLNERRMLVLLATSGGYRSVFSSDKVIPPAGTADNPCVVDPFLEQRLRIRKGVVMLGFDHWSSCGSWGMSSSRWTFRYDPARQGLRLIGFDATEQQRNAPGVSRLSVNLLTGQALVVHSPGEESTLPPQTAKGRVLGESVFMLGDTLPECQAVGADDVRCG
jgi:hypothetical protein